MPTRNSWPVIAQALRCFLIALGLLLLARHAAHDALTHLP